MECTLISIVFCVVSNVAIVVGQNPTLNASPTSVFEQETVDLICEHSATQVVSWWLNNERVTVAAESNGVCIYSPANIPSKFSACSCGNTIHSCTLKPLTVSNNGEVWTCAITHPTNGTVFRSNEQTLEVKVTTTLSSISTSTPKDEKDLSTYREVALAFGIIDLVLGLLVTIVTCPWVIHQLYKADAGKEDVKCDIILIALFIVWDSGILSSGSVLIANLNSEKGFKDGRIIYSLVCGNLCVAVFLVLATLIIIQVCLERPKKRVESSETEIQQGLDITHAAWSPERKYTAFQQQQLDQNSFAKTTRANLNMFAADSVLREERLKVSMVSRVSNLWLGMSNSGSGMSNSSQAVMNPSSARTSIRRSIMPPFPWTRASRLNVK